MPSSLERRQSGDDVCSSRVDAAMMLRAATLSFMAAATRSFSAEPSVWRCESPKERAAVIMGSRSRRAARG